MIEKGFSYRIYLKIRKSVLHPYLISVSPILFLFSHNISELTLFCKKSFIRLFFPIFIIIVFTGTLYFFFKTIIKNRLIAGFLTSIISIMFFNYNDMQNLYLKFTIKYFSVDPRLPVGMFKFGHYKLFFLLWIILLIIIIVLLLFIFKKKPNKTLQNTNYFVNIISIVFVFISIINIGYGEINRFLVIKNKGKVHLSHKSQTLNTQRESRNVYYIILDMYSANSTLKAVFDFDNHEFLESLRKKGFFIVEKSLSNYSITMFSLPSTLNMDYIDNIIGENYRKSRGFLPIVTKNLMKQNRVSRIFKSYGYKFIHFSTYYQTTEINEYADIDIACGKHSFLNDRFVRLLLKKTFLFKILNSIRSMNWNFHREMVLCQLDKLSKLKSNDSPFFVFAHIICPHDPYVFGKNGEKIDSNNKASLKTSIGKKLYINQLKYLNKRIDELITKIMDISKIPPIIIFQGDHGIRDIFNSDDENSKIALRIFNAIYMPCAKKNTLYQEMTPVNTFRIIFNTCFGEKFDLLEDKCFDFKKSDPNYKFYDVTEIVRYD